MEPVVAEIVLISWREPSRISEKVDPIRRRLGTLEGIEKARAELRIIGHPFHGLLDTAFGYRSDTD
jgi:hypothetical protein